MLKGSSTEEGERNGECGTENWMKFSPWQGGRVKFVKVVDMKNGNGDGRWPDKVDGVWSVCIKWDEGMTLKFEIPKELKGKL